MPNKYELSVHRIRVGSRSAKAVLLLLASMADADGVSFPSQDYIARVLEMDLRTVKRAIAHLRSGGFIVCRRAGWRNEYRLKMPVIGSGESGDIVTKSGDIVTKSGDIVTPINIKRNIKEHSSTEDKDSGHLPPGWGRAWQMRRFHEHFPEARLGVDEIRAILSTVEDENAWCRLLTQWGLNRNRLKVGNLLDAYLNRLERARSRCVKPDGEKLTPRAVLEQAAGFYASMEAEEREAAGLLLVGGEQ